MIVLKTLDIESLEGTNKHELDNCFIEELRVQINVKQLITKEFVSLESC